MSLHTDIDGTKFADPATAPPEHTKAARLLQSMRDSSSEIPQLEPLETAKPQLALYPLKYRAIYEEYKTAQELRWFPEHVMEKIEEDKRSFANMDEDERRLLEYVLTFFAVSDGVVNENIQISFVDSIKPIEFKFWYGEQMAMENIHNETYCNLLIALFGQQRAEEIISGVDDVMAKYPTISSKISFIRKYVQQHSSLARRLFINAIMEGLFFSSSFAVIFWINSGNMRMPALAKANEYISRDEGSHAEFAISVYNTYIVNKLSIVEAHEIIRQAVNVEADFINAAMPKNLIGMNATLMTQYIQYVADMLLSFMKYPKIYNVEYPFSFMLKQSIKRITDFFMSRPTEYNAVVGHDGTKIDFTVNDDEDF